jgi:anti-sigma B factor antagonist
VQHPVHLESEIDAANAAAVERRLLAYAEGADGDVVIDCSGLEFLDSTGLRALVAVAQRAEHRTVLIDLKPTYRRLLELTGLDSVFELR